MRTSSAGRARFVFLSFFLTSFSVLFLGLRGMSGLCPESVNPLRVSKGVCSARVSSCPRLTLSVGKALTLSVL